MDTFLTLAMSKPTILSVITSRILRVELLQIGLLSALLATSILWRGGKSIDVTWMFAIVTAMIVIVDIFRQRPSKASAGVVHTFLCVSVIGFVGLTILSFWLSHTANYGTDEVMHTVTVSLLFFWLVRECIDNERVRSALLRIIVLSTLVACFIGLIVYIGQPVSRMVGSFFDARFHTDYWPNAWAELLILCWPIALLLKRDGRVTTTVRTSVLLGILLGSLLLSFSRGGIIVVVIQVVTGAMMYVMSGKAHVPLRTRVPMIALILSTALALFFSANALRGMTFPVESVVKKATFSAQEKRSSVSERAQFWSQSTALTLERPLIGWGPYSFRFTQPRLQSSILATADHPHNVILKLSSERGIPAAVLFLAIIGVLACAAAGTIFLRRSHTSQADTPAVIALSLSLFGVLLHNVIDYNLQFVGIVLPSTVVAAAMYSITCNRAAVRCNRSIRLMNAVVATALLLFSLREGYGLFLSSVGRAAERDGNHALALEYYELAKWQLFSRDLYLSGAMQARALGRDDTEWMTLALSKNDQDIRIFTLIASREMQKGNWAAAYEWAERAYQRGKFNDVTTMLNYLEVVAHVTPEALPVLKAEFDSLIVKYAEAIESNVHFVALSKNVDALQELCQRMQQYFPEHSELYLSVQKRTRIAAARESLSVTARPDGILWR